MHERIRIKFKMNGQPLPIQSFDAAGGVRFEDESDAWPRSCVLEFDANNEITRTKMNWIRDRWGWNPGVFSLHVTVDEGSLVISGVDSRSLASGSYWLLVQIDSLILQGGAHIVNVDDDEETTLTLTATEDARRVVLRKPIDEWDDVLIRNTLMRPDQTFDGLTIADWLASDNPRESRKACLMNLMAKLRTLPDQKSPFLAHVQRIFLTDVERIYVETDDEMLPRLRELAAREDRPFFDEGPPGAAIHRRLLVRAGVPQHKLESFRQDSRNSMQVVMAFAPGAPPDGKYYADVDIDLGNPLRDIEGFIIHLGELLSGRKTDHLKLQSALTKKGQPTAPFIYYDVGRRVKRRATARRRSR